MSVADSTVMRMAKTSMRYNMQRQAELSRNIANIDTPRFVARDLKPLDFDAVLRGNSIVTGGGLSLATTSGSHFSTSTASGGHSYSTAEERKPFEARPTGNSVVMEQQMAKVGQTGMDYQLATNIYRKMQIFFKTAIGNRG